MGAEGMYDVGVPYLGVNVNTKAGPGGHRGALMAWNPVKSEKVWETKENFSVWSGILSTGGDVVFYDTLDGVFKAVDAGTGEVLWQFTTGSGIIGAPITYLGPDEEQYVAILSGVGGWLGLIVSGDLPLDDPTVALGAVAAFSDLGRYTNQGGMLHVFSLDD